MLVLKKCLGASIKVRVNQIQSQKIGNFFHASGQT